MVSCRNSRVDGGFTHTEYTNVKLVELSEEEAYLRYSRAYL